MGERTRDRRQNEDGERKCLYCEETRPTSEFTPRGNQCASCRRAYSRECNRQKRAGLRTVPETRECRLCGDVFAPTRWNNYLCSQACTGAWNANGRKAEKRCRRCRQVKSLAKDFDRGSMHCRECVDLYAQQLRRCHICMEIKSWSKFPPKEAGVIEPTSRCLECDRARGRAYHRQSQVKQRTRTRKVWERYGLTAAEYEWMLADQGGRCAICREPSEKTLHIDHDHTTGAVRALLCFSCNSILGLAQDDAVRLRSAILYLERHSNALSGTLW